VTRLSQAADDQALQANQLIQVAEDQARRADERAGTATEQVDQLTERLRAAEEDVSRLSQRVEAEEEEATATAARLLAAETEGKQFEIRALAAEEQVGKLTPRMHTAEERLAEAIARLQTTQADAQQAELRKRDAEEKAGEANKRMRIAEEEANQATAAALVAETKVKQAEMRSTAVEDSSAQTAAKNAELLEQLQQARGELVGAEERARLSEERSLAASERVDVVEGQLKELKVRLTVANTELPMGAVADSDRSALKDGLATQVRRPLTSILGVSLALQHNDPESRDGKELVRQLGTNARKLDRMIGVLLEVDRLANGTLRLNRRRTDLRALVRRVVEDSPDLANRNVHVEAEKVVVPVDPFMVEEMVDTLLSNANARTSSASHVWIKVEADPEGAVIAVDDTGADVPAERRNALTSSEDGSGRGGMSTGLAVLQRLAEVHAGRAWVEEREGGGASFRVFLPDVTEGAAEAAGQAATRTEADADVEETEASEE
jgi:K+-sensing histidine kinase KdpD